MIVPLHIGSALRRTAVLTPAQDKLICERLNSDYKIRTRFLLRTGVRISEGRYIDEHRECFREDHSAIFLPQVEGMGKKRCTVKNRAIILCPKGVVAVKEFFEKNVHLPAYPSMEEAIKRAAMEADFDTQYITTKMYRKTIFSWYFNCYPEQEGKILSTAGHNQATARGHYITYGFRKDDVKDMKGETVGWG